MHWGCTAIGLAVQELTSCDAEQFAACTSLVETARVELALNAYALSIAMQFAQVRALPCALVLPYSPSA